MSQPRYIQHIIEPQKLLLSWQPSRESGYCRLRRFVAELISQDGKVHLEYLKNTSDYIAACNDGFIDYPGFTSDNSRHDNVLPAFMRRLPPRKRNDFGRFLTSLRINPADSNKISDFALLGYSGAMLPGDGFTIINPFENAVAPFELIIDIQGYRHFAGNLPYGKFNTDMRVTFKPEPTNPQDSNAIMVIVEGEQIGYVCRGLNKSIKSWLESGLTLNAYIERINGTEEYPRIYAYTEVRG